MQLIGMKAVRAGIPFPTLVLLLSPIVTLSTSLPCIKPQLQHLHNGHKSLLECLRELC